MYDWLLLGFAEFVDGSRRSCRVALFRACERGDSMSWAQSQDPSLHLVPPPALQRVPWCFNPSTYANARAQVITMGQIQSPLAEDRIKFSRPVAEARYHSCRLIVGILQERKGGERFVHQEVGGSPCEYISVI